MRTSDAVTPATGLTASLIAVVVIYGLLTLVVWRLMQRQLLQTKSLKA